MGIRFHRSGFSWRIRKRGRKKEGGREAFSAVLSVSNAKNVKRKTFIFIF